MLAEKFDVLLSRVPRFVHVLGPFDSTFGKLLRLMLDLGVKARENRKNRSFKVLLSLGM